MIAVKTLIAIATVICVRRVDKVFRHRHKFTLGQRRGIGAILFWQSVAPRDVENDKAFQEQNGAGWVTLFGRT
jgi:hypothetical protein